jgi:hypothetical protein
MTIHTLAAPTRSPTIVARLRQFFSRLGAIRYNIGLVEEERIILFFGADFNAAVATSSSAATTARLPFVRTTARPPFYFPPAKVTETTVSLRGRPFCGAADAPRLRLTPSTLAAAAAAAPPWPRVEQPHAPPAWPRGPSCAIFRCLLLCNLALRHLRNARHVLVAREQRALGHAVLPLDGRN